MDTSPKSSSEGRCVALLLASVLLAVASPSPVEAQLRGIVGGALRPMVGSMTGVTESQRQRLLIRPSLVIDRERRIGAPAALSTDRDRRFILAVHDDGAAHLWDIERGVRIDPRLRDVVAGVVRGTGLGAEIVAVHRDGSASALRLDGERRTLGERIRGFDAGSAPVLSDDGATMAFRTREGRWQVAAIGGRPSMLPDAAGDAAPLLSPDGSTVVYRASSGTLVAGQATGSGVLRLLGFLDGCGDGVPITAGTFALDSGQVLLGDTQGRVCAWTLAGTDAPKKLFTVPAGDGAIGAVAASHDGTRVAIRRSGGLVEVRAWTASEKYRRLASVALSAGAAPLVLDTSRRWIFGGETHGAIAVHSYAGGEATRRPETAIGRLLSTARGWAVLDDRGRFDGSQGGIDALTWSGNTATRVRMDLPADAFSESYFEPGLLAKLGAPERAGYLTTEAVDLPGEGYLRPPRVVIDPVPADERPAGESVPVTVRLAESDYPAEILAGIRLYHNGRLVPDGRLAKADGIARFVVRLVSGRNDLQAVAVGDREIDGPSSPVRTISATAAAPRRSSLHMVAIGINDYPGSELRHALNDAQILARELRKRSEGLFSDVELETLLDDQAGKSSIEKRIRDVAASAHDVLVIYFSGHGWSVHDRDRGSGRSEWYLIPFAQTWASVSEDDIPRLALSSSELMRLLTSTPARHVFLVLDSCFSGAAVKSFQAFETLANPGHGSRDAIAKKSLRRIARVGGIHVLAAAGAYEKAKELMARDHGALTWLVLEGIRGAADGAGERTGDGRVAVQELLDYAVVEMPGLANRLVQDPVTQIPVAYSRGTDFALAEP